MDSTTFTLENINLEHNRVFRDAIHNYIYVENQLIIDLIDTREMQRLRRIKQLGGTYQVYQSAEHSRFSHSLGVYQITKMMCKDNCIGKSLSDYDKLSVQCAALLHDVGHGPFSHCFEDAFDVYHEDFTIAIIEKDSEVHEILEAFHSGFSNVVSSIIKKKHPNKVLVQMVSSQLDADRMDYLLRDSYFTGTTYGQFDLQRILRIMKVKDGRIVYKESGVQAIEDYILARYHMYWQVYYHATARSYEQTLISTFRRIRDLYETGYDFGDIHYLEPFLKREITPSQYVDLDESVVLYYFKRFSEGGDSILKDLSLRFLNRKLYAYTDARYTSEVIEKYSNLGYDTRYYVVTDKQTQEPYRHYGSEHAISEIEIIVESGTIALPEISEIVGAITNSKKNKEDKKVFYPKIES